MQGSQYRPVCEYFRVQMVSQVLVGSRAWTGQKEMKDTEASRGHLDLLDCRYKLQLPEFNSISSDFTCCIRFHITPETVLISLSAFYRECQDHRGRKERAGMLAQWWVLLSNLSTHSTHLKPTALAQCQSQVCSQHHFSDNLLLASWLLWLWLFLALSDIDLTFPHFPNTFEDAAPLLSLPNVKSSLIDSWIDPEEQTDVLAFISQKSNTLFTVWCVTKTKILHIYFLFMVMGTSVWRYLTVTYRRY